MFSGPFQKTALSQQRAKDLRLYSNVAERLFWSNIRARRFHGYKFRRQVPIGIYIVDFLCAQKRLVVELDGSSHFAPGRKYYDRKRESYLRSRGFQVIRFSNEIIHDSMEYALQELKTFLDQIPSP